MPQQWEPIEKNVQEAEVVERKRRKAVNCTPKSGHVENVHFLFFGILLLEVLIMGIYE